MQVEKQHTVQADLLLLLVALIWGFGFVAQRAGMDHIGPYTYNGIRFLLGSLCLLPLQGLTNAQHLCVDVVWSNERPRGLAARRFVAQMHMQASPK